MEVRESTMLLSCCFREPKPKKQKKAKNTKEEYSKSKEVSIFYVIQLNIRPGVAGVVLQTGTSPNLLKYGYFVAKTR